MASSDIQGNQYTVADVENIRDPVDKAIKNFELHPSILLIKNRIGKNISQNLLFNEVKAEVPKEINSINN